MHRDLSTAFLSGLCRTPRLSEQEMSACPHGIVLFLDHWSTWMDTGQEGVRDPGVQRGSEAAILPLIPLLGDGGGFEVGRKGQ